MNISDLNNYLCCAKVNFEAVVKQNPILGSHPIFQIAMRQLEIAIEITEKELTEAANDA